MSYDHRLLVARVRERMSDRPLILIGTVANELNVGRRTIEIAVKSQTGTSPRALREQLVLHRVRRLLRPDKPLLSIKEISFAVGYQSPRAFARAVRRSFGCTPQELRRRVVAGER